MPPLPIETLPTNGGQTRKPLCGKRVLFSVFVAKEQTVQPFLRRFPYKQKDEHPVALSSSGAEFCA